MAGGIDIPAGGGPAPGPELTPLQRAQRSLTLWEDALDKCSSGLSYLIGTLQLTRANVNECLKMVKHFENEVSRLSAGRSRGARVIRPIVRDY